nr:uncharacterized protein LOC127347831 [Lolium perenne]
MASSLHRRLLQHHLHHRIRSLASTLPPVKSGSGEGWRITVHIVSSGGEALELQACQRREAAHAADVAALDAPGPATAESAAAAAWQEEAMADTIAAFDASTEGEARRRRTEEMSRWWMMSVGATARSGTRAPAAGVARALAATGGGGASAAGGGAGGNGGGLEEAVGRVGGGGRCVGGGDDGGPNG